MDWRSKFEGGEFIPVYFTNKITPDSMGENHYGLLSLVFFI